MRSVFASIDFWSSKSRILNPKSKFNDEERFLHAYSLATKYPESFLADAGLVTFVYRACSDRPVAHLAVPIVHTLIDNAARQAIKNQYLMLAVRKMALEGYAKDAQEAIRLLTSRLPANMCVYSQSFLEALMCVASFDETGAVKAILDDLERRQPLLVESSEGFQTARALNNESLYGDNAIDLTQETAKENEFQGQKLELNDMFSKLWAGVESDES